MTQRRRRGDTDRPAADHDEEARSSQHPQRFGGFVVSVAPQHDDFASGAQQLLTFSESQQLSLAPGTSASVSSSFCMTTSLGTDSVLSEVQTQRESEKTQEIRKGQVGAKPSRTISFLISFLMEAADVRAPSYVTTTSFLARRGRLVRRSRHPAVLATFQVRASKVRHERRHAAR